MKRVRSSSAAETMVLAKEYAGTIDRGDIVCLQGDLGAGKTNFVRGFVQGLGLSGSEVSSPTFTVINEYEGTMPIYHFDCYRLEHYTEALEIGAEDYFYSDGVCIVEWPERILEILPNEKKWITFKQTGKEEREITFH
ncbi:MAG: tRNA (adenosine(37)-N6)-threonylcarbamoyltransferase complex ATPase subunit type 1 TsaE [Balneolaceae bacterium]|nr:MAG: tRNA (adenosine(37)-N6)-threonylcarbamoyltransferase complex ATPase subunit type 1 TsaE [Balneolaceae bacterium]